LYFLIKDDYSIPNVENFSWLVVFIPPILAWNFAVANAIFFKSFVKKDALITIVVVIVCILTYFSYEIIMTAIGTQPNLNVEYLVVPSVVFGALTISFMCSANSIFQKMYVRV
jgi:hypothetical protein